jgi:hypothetical protein
MITAKIEQFFTKCNFILAFRQFRPIMAIAIPFRHIIPLPPHEQDQKLPAKKDADHQHKSYRNAKSSGDMCL